ncbi:MAG: hypothetical protein RIT26_2294 [Pseudomonadota bacterium]|jgi:uncharacterized integral membrane protein
MKRLLGLLQTLLKAAIFFTLFAFALNNQDDVTVRFFFGTEWHTPLVLVVLAAFALGMAIGVLSMVPRWWRERRAAQKAQVNPAPSSVTAPSTRPEHGT